MVLNKYDRFSGFVQPFLGFLSLLLQWGFPESAKVGTNSFRRGGRIDLHVCPLGWERKTIGLTDGSI